MLKVKLITASVVAPALLLMAFQAWASMGNQGQGRVSMKGAIVDSACAIATDSREQYIDIGDFPVEQLIRDGHGPTRPFSIHLVNCVLKRSDPKKANWETFQVTFDGMRQDRYFGATGSASGVSLKITDADGNNITPGETQLRRNIQPEEMRLNYFNTPVVNKHPLKVGDYSSLIKFKLDYF